MVERRVSHRLFSKENGAIKNAGPGTCLDTVLVECQEDDLFDFYLIPHRATVATAQPVHFKVVVNSSKYSKDELETITYHLCYNYANFIGGIKVPSVCMYAKKIANYSHENQVKPNDDLSRCLHYV